MATNKTQATRLPLSHQAEQADRPVGHRRIGRKVRRRHQHHQQAAEDGTDIGHPGQHGADQAQRQRPGNAEQPETGGQCQRIEDGEVDQALEIGARGAVDFVQQVKRALEKSVGHGGA